MVTKRRRRADPRPKPVMFMANLSWHVLDRSVRAGDIRYADPVEKEDADG
jgi:hypothetical protein